MCVLPEETGSIHSLVKERASLCDRELILMFMHNFCQYRCSYLFRFLSYEYSIIAEVAQSVY